MSDKIELSVSSLECDVAQNSNLLLASGYLRAGWFLFNDNNALMKGNDFDKRKAVGYMFVSSFNYAHGFEILAKSLLIMSGGSKDGMSDHGSCGNFKLLADAHPEIVRNTSILMSGGNPDNSFALAEGVLKKLDEVYMTSRYFGMRKDQSIDFPNFKKLQLFVVILCSTFPFLFRYIDIKEVAKT